jgi:hypothetical protein
MSKMATDDLPPPPARARERPTRPSLPDLPRPDFDTDAETDDALKQRLAELGRGLGFTRREPLGVRPAAEPAPRPGAGQGRGIGPAPAAVERPPMKTLQLVIPDYLFEQLHMTAARRRVTKKYLVLQALMKDGYEIAPEDLDEDGRRNR